MTTKEQNGIDVKRLMHLYKESAPARAVLDHLASRERNWSSTTVDRVHTNVLADGGSVSRADIIDVFRELEAVGCGEFKTGRKGWPSRFEWVVQMVGVGQAAAGETESVEVISEEDQGEEAGAASLRHTFRLRPEVTVTLELPSDLKGAEAQRLADFVKTIPFAD